MREAELVENYMKLKGNSQIKAFKEIGYRQKKIDIVEFNLDSEEYIHGIEFKIKNWKEGYRQCLGNRILVPYNSLAIFHKYIKNVDKDKLVKKGIGLISLEEDNFRTILTPQKSKIINENMFNVVKKKIFTKLKITDGKSEPIL